MNDIEKLARKLVESNYKVVFGISGSGLSYQLISQLLSIGVDYFCMSSESAAAVAAGTYSFHYNEKAACISIKGPGFANLLSGIAACYFEKFNVLCISENFNANSSIESQHKRLNQFQMILPICKGVSSLSDIKNLNHFLKLDEVIDGPLYFDLANTHVSYHKANSSANLPSDNINEKIVDAIKAAKSPVLIVGSLLYRKQLCKLLEQIQVPVFTTVQAKGSLDENQPNACGVYTGVGEELSMEYSLIKESDCVLTIGLKNEEILDSASKQNFINLDVFQGDAERHVTYILQSEIGTYLALLHGKINWAERKIATKNSKLKDYFCNLGWTPASIYTVLNYSNKSFNVVLDTGFFCTVGEHILLSSNRKRFIASSNGRNMGLSVPMAFGISVKGEPVVCCFGDGGVRYHLGEIRTIASLGLPVCFILFTDGIYGSVAAYVDENSTNLKIVEPKGTSWFKVTEAMGIKSFTVKDSISFNEAFNGWDGQSPCFIEASFEQSVYASMTKKLRK
jgi:thiamine pyrophosphate-dependent acetolactate synthase large subunit-like protein